MMSTPFSTRSVMKLRYLAAVVAVALATSTLAGAGTATASETGAPLTGTTSTESTSEPSVAGIAHEVVYRDGAFVLTDGLFDARGAEVDWVRTDATEPLIRPVQEDIAIAVANGAFGSQRRFPDGDFQLPLDRSRWPDFTADIAELSLALRGGRLSVRFTFNSLPSEDAQLATLTIASESDAGPARPWPAGAGVSSPWSTALTMGGGGGRVEHPGGSTAVATNFSGHAISAELDTALLPSSPWRVTAGAGLADPSSPERYWVVPAGPATASGPGTGSLPSGVAVWDVAQAGPQWPAFGDRRQAELLAGTDLTEAGFVIDPSRRDGIPVAATGTLARTFTSRLDGGDGMARDLSGALEAGAYLPDDAPYPDPGPWTAWIYTGRLQHYGLHLPAGWAQAGPAPLVVWLHGSGGEADDLYDDAPELVAALAARGYLIATPLGRGDTFYRTGPGELDVLEVLADVSRNYAVDPDRVFLAGFSGGSAGVYGLGSRHPELFAGLLPISATYEDPTLVDNLASVPWFGIMGEADPISALLDGAGLYQALSDRGADASLLRYVEKTHEFSLIYDSVGWIVDFLDGHRRTRPPARVRWVTKPGDERPELGLTRGGAWWLADVRAADAAAGTRTTADSWGLGVTPGPIEPAVTSEELVDRGGRSGRTLARLFRTSPAPQSFAPRSNRLEITTANVASLTVDLQATGLTLHPRLVVSFSVDRPVTLRLVDGNRAINMQLLPGQTEIQSPPLLPL